MTNNIQNAQVQEHRDITKNPFVRYQKMTIEAQLNATVALITLPGTEIQLIADKAIELTLLNDAMGVFAAGEEADLEITGATKGTWVIEQLTGKTWQELNAPTTSDRISSGISTFINKAMNSISKGASNLAEKTRR